MGEIRNENEKLYESQKTESDSLTNVELCENIADNNFMWHVEESVYWTKRALKIIEKIYGKNSARNIHYYEKIINLLMEKGSYKEALKWSDKAIKLTEKLNMNNLSIIIYYAEINLEMKFYDECILHGDLAYNVITSDKFEKTKFSFELVDRLIFFYYRYIIDYDKEKKSYSKLINSIEIALQMAKEFYGDISIETAMIYREKAVYLELSKEEKLIYLKKALEIILSIDINAKLARQIFLNIRNCWPDAERLEEGFKWVYENISKQFVLSVLPRFTKFDQEKIKKAINI